MTDACSTMEPMAVIEYCNPVGTPMPMSLFTQVLSSFQSRRVRTIRSQWRMYLTHSSEETACEITVAHAAPSTPMPKDTINSKSSTTLSSEQMTR